MLPATFTTGYIKQLELLRLRSRRTYLGLRQGGHLSIKRGHGLEFADYRKYELGDHPRSIDWGVYARSDKLFVKRFQEEQDLSVLVMVDSSASMRTPIEEGKWQRAKDIALSISYIALMQQDNLSVAALGSFISPRYFGLKSIHHLAELFNSANTSQNIDLVKEVQKSAAKVRFPGVAVFISDFFMPFEQLRNAFNILRSKNLDITAIQVLGPSDINPLQEYDSAIAVDSETGEEISLSLDAEARDQYSRHLLAHNTQLQAFLKESKINYALALSQKDLGEFMLKYLPEIGLIA